MSTATLDETITIDPALMDELNGLGDSVECSFSGCEEQAVALLRCPCTLGSETMCGGHTIYVRAWQLTEAARKELITFNETCLHSPPVTDCIIVPIE